MKLTSGSTPSFYDALVIAAAPMRVAACFTEDLQHGRKFGVVTVQSTFLEET